MLMRHPHYMDEIMAHVTRLIAGKKNLMITFMPKIHDT